MVFAVDASISAEQLIDILISSLGEEEWGDQRDRFEVTFGVASSDNGQLLSAGLLQVRLISLQYLPIWYWYVGMYFHVDHRSGATANEMLTCLTFSSGKEELGDRRYHFERLAFLRSLRVCWRF